MARSRAGTVRRVAVPLIAAALTTTCVATALPATGPPTWRSPGLIGGGGWPYVNKAIDPSLVTGAGYLPGSSVVKLADGRILLVPFGSVTPMVVEQDDPRVTIAVESDGSWLNTGQVPGRTQAQRDMAARALLDLRLLTAPNGANTASWYGQWGYVWPRDAAFTAAAFAMTGHPADAARILRFLARVQNGDGLWAARYNIDGSAVNDGRRIQLDGMGWVLWAAWLLHTTDKSGASDVPELWPMVRRAADKVARFLDPGGLPPKSSDYFERDPGSEQDTHRPTLGVVAPLLTGMRAAAALAEDRDRGAQAHRWHSAADRLSGAVDRYFKPYGYPRSPVEAGDLDAAATFLSPPFAAADPSVDSAVQTAARRLRLPNGGVLPGEHWQGGRSEAWTPETAMFALAAAASGRTGEATGWLDWLQNHRSPLGVLPEKVDDKGRQSSVAPLGWTASLTVLALGALDHPIPIPPA